MDRTPDYGGGKRICDTPIDEEDTMKERILFAAGRIRRGVIVWYLRGRT